MYGTCIHWNCNRGFDSSNFDCENCRTSPREIAGIEDYCKKCGMETKGLNCPKCEKNSQSFGV